jgi:hypothetical protein
LFWEIAKSKNYNLLDINYNQDFEYTESQQAKLEKCWDDLYDQFYILKKDSSAIMALEKQNETFDLLYKINLLVSNLDSLVLLYENGDLIEDKQRFAQLEQLFYANFKLIDKRINIKYFDGLKANYDVVSRFILSLEASYDINHKRAEQAVSNEVKNVYTIIAQVGTALGMQLNAKDMSVLEFTAYEEEALKKIQSQKEKSNG